MINNPFIVKKEIIGLPADLMLDSKHGADFGEGYPFCKPDDRIMWFRGENDKEFFPFVISNKGDATTNIEQPEMVEGFSTSLNEKQLDELKTYVSMYQHWAVKDYFTIDRYLLHGGWRANGYVGFTLKAYDEMRRDGYFRDMSPNKKWTLLNYANNEDSYAIKHANISYDRKLRIYRMDHAEKLQDLDINNTDFSDFPVSWIGIVIANVPSKFSKDTLNAIVEGVLAKRAKAKRAK